MYMIKIMSFSIVFLALCTSCNNGCDDLKACNYGDTSEDCRYSDEQESLLQGSWNLVDILDEDDMCLFSSSSDYDCELDQTLQYINISFNEDKTLSFSSGISTNSVADNLGSWSINICQNILNFSNVAAGYYPYLYPDYLPFGNQNVIQLSSDVLIFEDLAGNVLRWEKL